MSTKISKTRFKEILKNLIRKEIEEASTTVSAGGGTGTGIYYDTPKAFSGKGKKDGVPLDRRKQVASGSGYEPVEEAKFAVTIDLGLKVGDGKVIVDAGSKGAAITMVAKRLKQGRGGIKSVSRVQPGFGKQVDKKIEGFASDAQRRAAFASGYKAKGKKKKKNETINEDGHTDVPSVVRKLKTSIEDSLQILGYLKKINDAEPLPSWWTDKVTLSANYLNSARDYILNPHESINEMSDKSKKVINKLGKKEKEVFLTMVDMLGFDQVMSDYKRDKKAFKQALKDMTESVFAVRQDKIKDDERYAKKPNFDYDPEKGKSRIRKVNEKVVKGTEKVLKFTKIKDKSLVKHLKDITKKVGADLQKYSDGYRVSADGDMKKLSAVVDYVMNKSIKKGIMTGGGMSNINLVKEQSINEARLNPKETIKQLGGNRFLYMVGAKNLAVDKPRNELHMKIMRNAKGVSHVVIKLTSLDLYDMRFLQIRAGKIRVKATEKGVYGDQLATFFKKHTGLNTRL